MMRFCWASLFVTNEGVLLFFFVVFEVPDVQSTQCSVTVLCLPVKCSWAIGDNKRRDPDKMKQSRSRPATQHIISTEVFSLVLWSRFVSKMHAMTEVQRTLTPAEMSAERRRTVGHFFLKKN